MIELIKLLETTVVNEFRRAALETGQDTADTKSAAIASIAVSLKRIADHFERQEAKPERI
jgi:hypothetical protein